MAMIAGQIRHEALGIDWHAFRHPLRWAAAGAIVFNLVESLLDWLERARERRQLLALGDRALQDFGASRADAVREGDKLFWRS